MKREFNLNVAPLELYPIIKVLTKSDMTTSQLVLPRHAVEDYIINNFSDQDKRRLREGGGRINIWLVDDEDLREYYLTIVDRDHRYSIISWSHVLKHRDLREGQEIRFGWILNKLHFVVMNKDGQPEDEYDADREDNGGNGGEGGTKGAANDPEMPPRKRITLKRGEFAQKGSSSGVNL